jgi:phospholipid/cholesterol/gamma-HCH transport system substrate-binding protein
MKISNETKVGALTSIAIVFLILGFNFLKGKSLFKHGNFLYAKFTDTKGLMSSNPVMVNGYQVGTVYEISTEGNSVDTIVVSIKLNKDYQLPKNSVAYIKESIMSSPTIEIELGNRKDLLLQSGDYIAVLPEKGGLLGDLQTKVGPLSDKLTVAASSLDSLIKNFNSTLDPATRMNLQHTMANLQKISTTMLVSSASLQRMLDEQGTLAKSLENVNSFTTNLAGNNDKLNATIDNLQKTSRNLSDADIKGTIAQLQNAVNSLNTALASKDGSLGLLLNDKQFYNNLVNTSRSANVLLDDLRVNPKRYVNLSFSIFGRKKSDGDYLKEPLPIPKNDTTGKK